MMNVTKLDKAKVAIGLDHPFFASILYKRGLVEDSKIPTLQVDARGTIYYNPQFVESLTVPQIVWCLCHEVGHVIAQHALRRHNRDPKAWNYAGDAWINDTLDACNVGERVPNTINMPGAKDKTTEEIYNSLPDNDGSGGDDQGGMGNDVIYGEGISEAEAEEIAAQVKIDVAQAAQIAKAKGALSGALEKFVHDFIHTKTPWYDHLERYMTDMVKSDYTWSRPNRRFLASGLYMPSKGNQPTMGEVVLQIDVSGSVSQKEIEYYNGHIKRITEVCNPTKVHVLYTDSEVLRHDEFEQGDEVNIEFYSGGGTCMESGFKYLMDKGIDPSVVVTLTDAYDCYSEAPPFPVVWCVSTDQTPPYGDIVRFEME